jgi:hypothetical protein
LSKTSPDGKSYNNRIDALKTEKQLNTLFEDMTGELPFGRQFFANQNPVHTGGPMQVSIDFATQHLKERSYPYPLPKTVRDEVSPGVAASISAVPSCSTTTSLRPYRLSFRRLQRWPLQQPQRSLSAGAGQNHWQTAGARRRSAPLRGGQAGPHTQQRRRGSHRLGKATGHEPTTNPP